MRQKIGLFHSLRDGRSCREPSKSYNFKNISASPRQAKNVVELLKNAHFHIVENPPKIHKKFVQKTIDISVFLDYYRSSF